MSYLNQKTINLPVKALEGVGLHSGLFTEITIKPAKPNTGILFKRVDLKENNIVIPNFAYVSSTSLNTTIQNDFGVKISTIEHLMGALFGLGIDNAIVEIR
jgi:UDP-3-O-[3-hydroxymyristoyl] N-acetylglucosamine deacetylase